MSDAPNTSKSSNRPFESYFSDSFVRLANHSEDAVYHYDIGSNAYLFCNQIFRSFFHVDTDPAVCITYDHLLQSIHPEDHRQFSGIFRPSQYRGQTEGEIEYRIPNPDGSIRWLQDRWIAINGENQVPVAFQGFIRDISRRKLSELQFIGSKENALIGSYIVQQGTFKYVNPKFTSIMGYTEKELIGSASLSFVHEDYRKHVRQCAATMLKGDDLTPYEFCVIDKSGSQHWVMETVSPVIYKGKRAALGYFMDITKLHEIRDNLATLGMMLGTISHSLRGCLTGLNASLYHIENGFYRNNQAQIEEGLDLSKLMVDRVRKLVLDILYYSKERDLETEKVEVWRFAKEVTILIENRIKAANIQFSTHFPHDSGFFDIDQEVIRTTLLNILENAMEACIEDERSIDHHIDFSIGFDADHVYFEITDNGPGMEEKQVKEIFRLFSSTKGKRGTGIGLFVSRKNVLKHGGTITVVSSPDSGATFRITLPRVQYRKQ